MPVVSSAKQHDLASINGSTNLDDYAVDTSFVFEIGADPLAGAVTTDVSAVDVVSGAYDGLKVSSFADIFYNRIWVIERNTDLGNIVANQTRQIELWNAYFESKTFSAYTVDGDIQVTGTASATMNALESLIYDVFIPVSGSPVLDATITWTFTAVGKTAIVAYITGQRVIPFLLRHNWTSPVVEQLSFKTDVLQAISGKEQRIGLINEPRRRVEMTYLTLSALERAYLENVTFGWQNRVYAVPLWQDATRLRSSAAIGATVFDVDTVTRDFDIGGLVLITNGVDQDVLEVISVTTDSVTTKTGSIAAYSAGAKIVPARLGVLDNQISLSRLTNHHEDIKLAWALQSNQVSTNRKGTYSPTTYRGVGVFNISNDYANAIDVKQEVGEDMSDNSVGIFRNISIGNQMPRRTYTFKELRSRDELGEFIAWVYSCKGKLNPFWFVERVPSFFLQSDALSSDTNLIVEAGNYTQFSFPSAARRDIAIKTSSGWVYRRITGSVVNVDGTETITLESSLGVALHVADNPLMCFLKFVRLDQDMVEMSFESDGVIQTASAFTDLLTNN